MATDTGGTVSEVSQVQARLLSVQVRRCAGSWSVVLTRLDPLKENGKAISC